MKLHKPAAGLLGVLILMVASIGCTRAVRDGVSIGVTEGLSDGIATLITDFIASFGTDGA